MKAGRSKRCPECWRAAHPIRECPVCRQIVHPTVTGMTAPHCDSLGRDLCPGERLPFNCTIPQRQTGLMTA